MADSPIVRPTFPALETITRVIPVAQTQRRGDIAITILSIDCYQDGWVANLCVRRDAKEDYFPFFRLDITHDPDQRGGSRWGAHETWHHRNEDRNWYFSYVTTPALGPQISQVHLTVPVIHLLDRPPRNEARLVRSAPGPWAFTVTMTAGMARSVIAPPATVWSPLDVVDDAVRAAILESREQRKTETMARYGAIYDDILDLIYRYDPIGIGWSIDNPHEAEEYALEADTFVPRLSEAKTETDVHRILIEEFRRWFGHTAIRDEAEVRRLSREIWDVWRLPATREGEA